LCGPFVAAILYRFDLVHEPAVVAHECGHDAEHGITEPPTFRKVGVVREGLAQAGLVVAKLCFGNRQVLPDADTFRAVGAGLMLRDFDCSALDLTFGLRSGP
jgi:hypothetical protein